jgi:hypothetical protein
VVTVGLDPRRAEVGHLAVGLVPALGANQPLSVAVDEPKVSRGGVVNPPAAACEGAAGWSRVEPPVTAFTRAVLVGRAEGAGTGRRRHGGIRSDGSVLHPHDNRSTRRLPQRAAGGTRGRRRVAGQERPDVDHERVPCLHARQHATRRVRAGPHQFVGLDGELRERPLGLRAQD